MYAAVKKATSNSPPAAPMTSMAAESTSLKVLTGRTKWLMYASPRKIMPARTVVIMMARGRFRFGSLVSSAKVETASNPR
ncbi:hypothetical protein D3C73_1455840 [compost metagenome]